MTIVCIHVPNTWAPGSCLFVCFLFVLYWMIVASNFDSHTSTCLYNLPQETETDIILGKRPDMKMADDQCQLLFRDGCKNLTNLDV